MAHARHDRRDGAARCVSVAAAFLALSSAAADAQADTSAYADASPEVPPFGFAGSFAIGGAGGGMLATSLDAVAHYSVLEGGLLVEHGAQILSHEAYEAPAVLLGLGSDMTRRLRVSLLGELGDRYYTDVGTGLFGPSRGGSASIGYAGVRFGMFVRWRDPVGFAFGFWFFARKDFGSELIHASCSHDDGWLCASNDTRIGGTQAGFVLRLGFSLDGGPGPPPPPQGTPSSPRSPPAEWPGRDFEPPPGSV